VARLHLVHDVLDIVERSLVLHVVLEISAGDFVLHEFASLFGSHARLDVQSDLRHRLFHVNQICLGRELLVHVRLVRLSWEYLLQLLNQLNMMVEHLVHSLE